MDYGLLFLEWSAALQTIVNKNTHLCSAYYVTDIVLSYLYMLTHLVLRPIQ
jgi:hypothetical protein